MYSCSLINQRNCCLLLNSTLLLDSIAEFKYQYEAEYCSFESYLAGSQEDRFALDNVMLLLPSRKGRKNWVAKISKYHGTHFFATKGFLKRLAFTIKIKKQSWLSHSNELLFLYHFRCNLTVQLREQIRSRYVYLYVT